MSKKKKQRFYGLFEVFEQDFRGIKLEFLRLGAYLDAQEKSIHEERSPDDFDRKLALDTGVVVEFVQQAQANECESFRRGGVIGKVVTDVGNSLYFCPSLALLVVDGI